MGYSFDKKRHIHFLDNEMLTGTTTALSIVEKPGLTWWSSGKAVERFGWKDPKKHSSELCEIAFQQAYQNLLGMSLDEFKAHVRKAYRAHKDNLDETADAGVDLHEEGQKYIQFCLDNNQGRPTETIGLEDDRIKPFIAWAVKNVKQFLWAELHHYDETLRTGGISDNGYYDMQDRLGVGDFKSAPKAYFGNFLQAASYDLQLSRNGGFTPDGKKIFELPKPIDFYAIFPFGGGFKEPTIVTQIVPYRYGFKSALQLYRLRKEFEGE